MSAFTARWFKVHTAYADMVEQQQAQRLLIMNVVWMSLLLLLLPVMLVWIIQNEIIDIGTGYAGLSLFVVGIIHWMIQNNRLKQARVLFVINIFIAATLTTFPNYRIDTPFIFVFSAPLVAAGALLKRTGLLATALALILVVSGGGFIQYQTGMESSHLAENEAIQTTLLILLSMTALDTIILWAFVGGVDDVTHQQYELMRLIETTAQISQTLTAVPASNEELNQAVEQLRDALSLYHVQIFVTDPSSGLAIVQASTGFMGRRLLEEGGLLIPDEKSPINDALRQSDPILILEDAPPEKRVAFLPATRSELLVPLRVGELFPIGVLDLHSTMPNTFSKHLLAALKIISNELAMILYNSQQGKEVRSGYQERDQLLERIEANQREIARLNRQLIGATWGTYLEEKRDVPPGFDWYSGTLAQASEASELIEQTLSDGQVRLEKRGGQDILCIPIKLRGQMLGALEFQRESETGWSAAALELAQAVAERLALSLENARLFEQAQTTAHREQLVSQVTTQLQATGDLQGLLSQAAIQFQDALGAVQTRIRLGTMPTDQ